jgi:hypothetical protein
VADQHRRTPQPAPGRRAQRSQHFSQAPALDRETDKVLRRLAIFPVHGDESAPKNTPVEIIERLNTEVSASIADPQFQARLANLGGAVLAGSPADFGKLISDETKKWGKVIVAANIKPQ